MLRKTSYVMLALTALLLCLPAFSQVDEQGKSEVSAQFFGTFVAGTDHDRVRQTSSDSGGILATYRLFFSKHHGVEANYGYSRSTQKYGLADGQSGVNASQHEVSGAYVFRVPMRRLTPYALGGVAALVFDPRHSFDASRQTRAAFVYGGGADLNLARHLFVRAQYRGFVYKSPTFDVFEHHIGRTTHLAEPSIGLGFRF